MEHAISPIMQGKIVRRHNGYAVRAMIAGTPFYGRTRVTADLAYADWEVFSERARRIDHFLTEAGMTVLSMTRGAIDAILRA